MQLVDHELVERHDHRVGVPGEGARVEHARRAAQPTRLLARVRVRQFTFVTTVKGSGTAEREAVVVAGPQTQRSREEPAVLGLQGLTPYEDLVGVRRPHPHVRQTPTDGDSAETIQSYSSGASQTTPSGGRVSSAE